MGNVKSPLTGVEENGNANGAMLLEYWMPADTKAVPDARHAAMRVCGSMGIDEEVCADLDLALGEALANAVVHGQSINKDGPGENVHLGVWDYKDHLIVEVTNHGPRFHPPDPPYQMPLAITHDIHGRGLPLMQNLTDAMVVCEGDCYNGGASIFLIKKISTDQSLS